MIESDYKNYFIGETDISGVSQCIMSMNSYEIVDNLNESLVDRELSANDKLRVEQSINNIQKLVPELCKFALSQDEDRRDRVMRLSLEIKRCESQIVTLLNHNYRVSLTALPNLKLFKVASLVSLLFASINQA